MTRRGQRVKKRRGRRRVGQVRFRDRFARAVKRTLLVLLILGGLGGLGAAGYHLWLFTQESDMFELHEVVVSGVDAPIEAQIRALVDEMVAEDTNLFHISPRTVKVRIAEHPRLDPRTVRVSRHWPNTLSISAEERFPVATVVGPRLMLIDADGWLIEQGNEAVQEADLPLLTGLDDTDFIFGEQITDEHAATLLTWLDAIRHLLPRLHRQLSELNISPSGEVTLHLLGGTTVRLGDRPPQEQLPVLLTFTRDIEDNLTNLALLDLRMEDHLVYRRSGAPSPARQN